MQNTVSSSSPIASSISANPNDTHPPSLTSSSSSSLSSASITSSSLPPPPSTVSSASVPPLSWHSFPSSFSLSFLQPIIRTLSTYYEEYAITTFVSIAFFAAVPVIVCAVLFSQHIQNTPVRTGGLFLAFLFEIVLTYSVRYIQRRVVTPMYTYVIELRRRNHHQYRHDNVKELGTVAVGSKSIHNYHRTFVTLYHNLLLFTVYMAYFFLLFVLIFCILGSFVSMGRIIPLGYGGSGSISSPSLLYDPPLWSTIALSCFGIGIQMLWITVAGDIGYNILGYLHKHISPYFTTPRTLPKILTSTENTEIPKVSIDSSTSTSSMLDSIRIDRGNVTSTSPSGTLSLSFVSRCASALSSIFSCCSRNCGVCLRGNCRPFPLPLAMFLFIGIIIASITGLIEGHSNPSLKRTTIPLARLPQSVNGFRIAVITDTHIGPAIGGTKVAYAVDLAIASAPDIVVLVGDIIDGDEVIMRPALEPFRKLGQYCNNSGSSSTNNITPQQPPSGQRPCQAVYYVSGNHCSDIGTLRDKLLLFQYEFGITVLHNKLISIGFVNSTSTDDTFDLAGVPDWLLSRTSKDEINHAPTPISSSYPPIDPSYLAQHDLLSTVKNRNTSRELVVLAHQPAHGTQAASVGTGLLISGHVHGGQLTPVHLLAKQSNKFYRGLEQATREETDPSNPQPMYAYTSYGTYQWGPLFRQFAPNEVSVLELVRA